jgi:WD40 repeat protein
VPTEVSTAHVSNDGAIVLVNSKGVGHLFESASGRQLGQPRPNSVNTGFLPDGQTPFAAPWGGPFVLLDPRTGDQAGKGFQGYQVKSVTFSRDGRLAAVGQMRGVVAITELASGQQKSFNVYDRNQEIEGLAFSPDGQRVLAVTKGAAKCIDVATGAEAGTVEGLPSMKLAMLPDGRVISVSRQSDSDLEVRDFASGKIVGRWTGHTGSIKGLAVSRRGDFVTASTDKTARSWDTASGKSQLLWQHNSELKSAAFSADGQNLVIGGLDGTVKVWTALLAPAAAVVPNAPAKPVPAPEEKPSAPAMATAEREAAKQILESGGKVKVAIGSSKIEVSTVEDLPAIGVVTSATLRSSMKSDAGMEIVGNLIHIERLPLEYSSITSAGLSRLANLKQVKFIHLYRAPVTDDGLITLGQLTSLEEVFLNSTRITNAGVAHLKGLKNLRTLALGEINNISGEALEPLAGIETLTRLDLNVTAVNDQDLEKLGRWTRLVSLDLFTTPISDVGLAHLHGLKNLVHLQVGRTKVTDAGVAAFQAAVPKCKVGRVP